MGYGYYYDFRPYVSVAERRRIAAREMRKLKEKGHPVSPVAVEGRTIARTFWGKSWCDNLERYSDFDNRLPRGRTYVRNGSVVDLQIAPGEVKAFVMGSELYRVAVKVSSVPGARWSSICSDCAGAIDSLVELLQGRFSKGVMERICERDSGLFPAPAEIAFSCNCPDWASMCKHVAAVLYGIGARLDEKPELLFRLRRVDEKALLHKAGKGLSLSRRAVADQKVLAVEDLSELFGLELGSSADEPAPVVEPTRTMAAARRSATRVAAVVGGATRARAKKGKATRKTASVGTSSLSRSALTKTGANPKGAKKPRKSRTAPVPRFNRIEGQEQKGARADLPKARGLSTPSPGQGRRKTSRFDGREGLGPPARTTRMQATKAKPTVKVPSAKAKRSESPKKKTKSVRRGARRGTSR